LGLPSGFSLGAAASSLIQLRRDGREIAIL
jgi:hypothetical protein